METAPLSNGYRGVGKTRLSQYFTPPCVVRFIWQVLEVVGARLAQDTRVIDPAAGLGGLVDWALESDRLKPENVFGIELDAALVAWRQRQNKQGLFYVGDGLLDEFSRVKPGSFDLIVGNPPFGRTDRIFAPEALPALGARYEVWCQEYLQTKDLTKLGGFPVDVLFIERALELVRPQGLIAMIMPEGFLANTRLQAARDWTLAQAQLLTVIGLPPMTFRWAGLNAKTALVILRKRADKTVTDKRVWLAGTHLENHTLEDWLEETRGQLKQAFSRTKAKQINGIKLKEKALIGCRWDVGYWQGQGNVRRLQRRFPLGRLGDYITHLTYGPIVTGQRPEHFKRGIRVIRQGDFVDTGLRLERALRVRRGGVYDPARSRVYEGDLLLPRSGVGALGRNRLAVYMEKQPANIGCFVDLIRLTDLNAFYAWIFFKTAPGWEQIRAYSNGVGTPNINFGEIRDLHVPLLPAEMQDRIEQRYRKEIWPIHGKLGEGGAAGNALFQALVEDLQNLLVGNKSVFK